ncbi:response regulator transcription factor [Clostridium faecium]|uniref:Stage 0 sporulation protein A homolog n=1 Tax=Clostridium faecium TaxID=2762223 RepID=A0ABR8YSN0_9CLOT|nr:response regulator transcription factor [Clostridium faecium]MBD8047157.1 response regulator transcription factor [Clostridium faecium]
MYKIFIVEDNLRLRTLIKDELIKYDYEVVESEDFKNIVEHIEIENPDLIILDINLPYYDGFYLCRTLRRKSNVPIIIISSRDTAMDQVMGLELGTDDYITKPFIMDVLIAKIKSLIRRIENEHYNKEIVEGNNVFNLYLNEDNLTLCFNGKSAELTKNEFKIVKILLDNNRIVRREELLSELWEDSIFVDDNTLTVNVTRVKNRLKELGLKDVIKTKKGVGYKFDIDKINCSRKCEGFE